MRRNLFLLALAAIMCIVLPAHAAEFTAKEWYEKPDWSKTPPEKAVVALVIGINQYPNMAIAKKFNPDGSIAEPFHPKAEQSALKALEGLTFWDLDGVMFLGNAHASATNLDAFLDGLPGKVDTLYLYFEGGGVGVDLGDPMLLLSDSPDYDAGYRVAALKKKLAAKAYNVVIEMHATHPGEIRGKDGAKVTTNGPTAKDFFEQGSEINGMFMSVDQHCSPNLGEVTNTALYKSAASGKDLTGFTFSESMKSTGTNCPVRTQYSGEMTAQSRIFPGSGIVTQPEPEIAKIEEPQTTKSSIVAPPVPVRPPAQPSAFVRQLPKFGAGVALAGASIASFLIAENMCGDITSESWARSNYDSYDAYLNDPEVSQTIGQCNGLVAVGVGSGVLGAGSLAWGGIKLMPSITPRKDSADVRLTVQANW